MRSGLGLGLGIQQIQKESFIPFITSWKTDNTGVSGDNQVRLMLAWDGTYDFIVDWGDESSDHITIYNQAEATHTYSSIGTYEVKISGIVIGWAGGHWTTSDADKLIDISQWGCFKPGNSGYQFNHCDNLIISAIDALNLSGITTLIYFFSGCALMNYDISGWDVSNIIDMTNLFVGCSLFNQNIGNWDTSNVTNMSGMFNGASIFNQNIGNWDTSSITDMNSLFKFALAFNQDINGWAVSKVTNMHGMFWNASVFNQSLSNWETGSVTNMSCMFEATLFNQDISSWDISKVTSMSDMFWPPSALSQANYDLLLVAWEAQDVRDNVPFYVNGTKYSAGAPATARAALIADHNWDIFDGGQA